MERLLHSTGCVDCSRKAKALIVRFGSLRNVLTAAPEEIRRALEGDQNTTNQLLLLTEAILWSLKQAVDRRPLFDTQDALLAYLKFTQGFSEVEKVRAMFLDAGNRLIVEEVISMGQPTEATIYARELVRRCLELGAVGLILVHNHPSGNPLPSQADRVLTVEVRAKARVMGVCLQDHLIVARDNHYSFRKDGFLP
ncbi:RadC family protein [Sphingomonas sp. MMS12-HWE2-04]|uniref:JAB domain-containing protein n=1 Tax=Sphingomonas sp. MMS12-HWE2-04 TaxID=3234199 RepID=UPI00384FB76A